MVCDTERKLTLVYILQKEWIQRAAITLRLHVSKMGLQLQIMGASESKIHSHLMLRSW